MSGHVIRVLLGKLSENDNRNYIIEIFIQSEIENISRKMPCNQSFKFFGYNSFR